MHGWYSYQHDLACGCVIYKLDGKPRAFTFVCKDKARGEEYIRTQMPRFTDYVYVGVVGAFVTESRSISSIQEENHAAIALHAG